MVWSSEALELVPGPHASGLQARGLDFSLHNPIQVERKPARPFDFRSCMHRLVHSPELNVMVNSITFTSHAEQP